MPKKWPSLDHYPCPTARHLGSRVSDLIFFVKKGSTNVKSEHKRDKRTHFYIYNSFMTSSFKEWNGLWARRDSEHDELQFIREAARGKEEGERRKEKEEVEEEEEKKGGEEEEEVEEGEEEEEEEEEEE